MSIDHAIAKIEAEMPRYPSSDAIHNVRTLLRIFQADGNGKSRTGYETFVFDMIARDIRESRADDLARDVKHIFEHVVQDLLAGGHISEDKFVDRALDSMRQVTAQLHANIAMLSKKEGDKWELDFNSKFFLTFNFCF